MGCDRSSEQTRLDAFLARAGHGTRREVRELIRGGRVSLDGTVCRRAGEYLAGRTVCLDGEAVEARPDVLHLVLHKPIGVACSHNIREAPIVDGLLPPEWSSVGLRMVGRLDRETSGLLILTTDGALLHELTHPNRKVEKRYRVSFGGALPEDAVARCETGFRMGDDEVPTRPARLELDGPGQATICLREGRHRQVRRMFACLGVKVKALHRDRVGGYDLPLELGPGEWRLLETEDLERLRADSNL